MQGQAGAARTSRRSKSRASSQEAAVDEQPRPAGKRGRIPAVAVAGAAASAAPEPDEQAAEQVI